VCAGNALSLHRKTCVIVLCRGAARYILSAEDNQVLAEEIADVASQSRGDAMCFAVVSGACEDRQCVRIVTCCGLVLLLLGALAPNVRVLPVSGCYLRPRVSIGGV
jgi:hypothetical protein